MDPLLQSVLHGQACQSGSVATDTPWGACACSQRMAGIVEAEWHD